MEKNKKIIVIIGPTAVGKTAVAHQIAKKIPAELINADSRQFYTELNIGTAKPTEDEREGLPYHLIDCTSIQTPWSVAHFVQAADQVIQYIRDKEKTPILVGGTGMYLQSLLSGLSSIPDILPEIRDKIRQDHEDKGLDEMYQELCACDPESAQALSANDTQRILRALEVFRQTGKSIRYFWKKDTRQINYEYVTVGLKCDRSELYERINDRVDRMLEEGLESEAAELWQEYPDNEVLQKTIGYAEWIKYGFDNQELVSEKIKQNTRNFAKRQLTWYRKEEGIEWFEADAIEDILKVISSSG